MNHLFLPRLACGLMVLFSAACHNEPQEVATLQPTVSKERIVFSEHAPQLPAILTAAVEAAGPHAVQLGGRLAWNDDVTIHVYAPVAGRVLSVTPALGDQLHRGDELAVIDSPDLGQAQADLGKAATDLAQADKALTRLGDLFEHGAAPRKDLEAAEADRARAVTERDRAQARLSSLNATAKTIDQRYRLLSPSDGIVVDRVLAPGQEVRADAALANLPQVSAPHFTITDPTHLWLWIDVPEVELAQVKAGLDVTICCRTWPERTFPGRIDIVAPSLDPVTRIGRVRAVVANLDLALKAEQYVSCTIHIPTTPTHVHVPKRAVFLDGERWYVFVQEKVGQFVRRAVSVGAEAGEHMTITEGLTINEVIVTEGALLLNGILGGMG